MEFFGPLSALLLDYGYLAVFVVLLLCGLGLPLPEELTLIAAGLVVYEGQANLLIMIGVTVLGILAGDSMLLFMGRRFGPQLLNKSFFRKLLHADRMNKVRKQFDKHGVKAVFFARFFAGIRACGYFTAGTRGMRYRVFVLLDLSGALISAPISVWLGLHFGGEIERALAYVAQLDNALMICLGILSAYFLGRWVFSRLRAGQRR